MKGILILLLAVCSSGFAQELQLISATKQTINGGASPTSVTNYQIRFKKDKSFKWSVDSVVNINTGASVSYTLLKVDDPALASPDFKPVKCFLKKDKGMYQVTFASSKNRGAGRPGSPTGIMVELPAFPKGAVIYYRAGKNKKQLSIEIFEELDTINAP